MMTDVGRSPDGSGQSGLRPEPASRLGQSATVPNAVVLHAVKPFSVYGKPITSRQIAAAIDMLANVPNEFIAMDLVPAVLPGSSFHDKQEAINRLFQRWRKLGLAEFKRGRWRLTRGAWDTLQASGMEARRAASEAAVHDSPVGDSRDAEGPKP